MFHFLYCILKDCCFICLVLLLLNIPVNSCGHVRMVTSDSVGLLPNIEMNDTSSPAIKHHPGKQLRHICMGGGIPIILD